MCPDIKSFKPVLESPHSLMTMSLSFYIKMLIEFRPLPRFLPWSFSTSRWHPTRFPRVRQWMFRALVRRRPSEGENGFHFLFFIQTRVICWRKEVVRMWKTATKQYRVERDREGCVFGRDERTTRVSSVSDILPHVSSVLPDASRPHPDGEIWSRPFEAIRLLSRSSASSSEATSNVGASTRKRDILVCYWQSKKFGPCQTLLSFLLLLSCPFSFHQIRPLLHTHTHSEGGIKIWVALPSKWRIETDWPQTRAIHLFVRYVSWLFIFWHFLFSRCVRVLEIRKKKTRSKNKNTQIRIILF